MELIEAVRNRRSIRRYKKDPVQRELIDRILQDALWAPSNMNRQAWEIVAVAGPSRDELLAIISKSSQYLKLKLEERFPHKPDATLAALHFLNDLGGAPVVLLFYAPRGDSHWQGVSLGSVPDVFAWERTNRIHSVAALLQNVCLLAHEAGLGTCWMTGTLFVEQEISAYLDMQDYDLIAITPLGYPDHSPKAPMRKGEKVRWLGF